MIGTSFRLIQTFAAVCSACGRRGPDADGQPEAIALAKDEGWQHWIVIGEGERIDVFRCYEMNSARIPTGEIPGSQCPKCGAPLLVIDKKQPNAQYWARNPQFVGCQNYHVTGCTYRRKVVEADRVTMKKAAEEFAALPAEF